MNFAIRLLALLMIGLAPGCGRAPRTSEDAIAICQGLDTTDFAAFPGIHVVRRGRDGEGDPIFYVFPPDSTVKGYGVVTLHAADLSVKKTVQSFLSDSLRVDPEYLERAATFFARLDLAGIHLEADADLVVVPYPTEYFRLFRRTSASHALPHPAQAWANLYKNWYVYDAAGR